MTPYNVIICGSTNSAGEFQETIVPPAQMTGPCAVRLRSFYAATGGDECEISLRWGAAPKSYDTRTRGMTETILVSTERAESTPIVYRDIPPGPAIATVRLTLAGIANVPAQGVTCVLQLEVSPECMC